MSDKLLMLRLVNLEWKIEGLTAFVDSLQQQMARLQREIDFNGEAIRRLNGRVHLGELVEVDGERQLDLQGRIAVARGANGEGDL